MRPKNWLTWWTFITSNDSTSDVSNPFLFRVFFNAVLGHLNLRSCMSGATVCRFTVQLNAARAGRPTFNLPTGGTNQNISWCTVELRWKAANFDDNTHECSYWRKHFIFHTAGRDVGRSLSFTKGTSRYFCLSLFCFCLLIFLLFFVHLFLKFWKTHCLV